MSDIDIARLRNSALMPTRDEVDALLDRIDSLERAYSEAVGALSDIDTMAVSLPEFSVKHEGGVRAVAQNIVDAIEAARERIDSLERTAAAAERALKEAQRDAGRYRWLRDKANDAHRSAPCVTRESLDPWRAIIYGAEMDAAIDAVMAKEQTE